MTATSTTRRRRGKRRGRQGGGAPPAAALVATAQPPPAASMDRLFAGRYQVGRFLGMGSFKDVHQARDVLTGHDVALGVYRDSPESSERFVERHLAVLDLGPHPCVTQVHDAGVGKAPNGSEWPYVAMELLTDVRTVRGMVNMNNGPLPVPVVLRLAQTSLDGLRHLHRGGLVHGSAHGANILMTFAGRAKLADFDWVMPAGHTRIGADDLVAITGHHQTTPEQLRGMPHDERADAYVTALTIYLAACGRYPFDETPYLDNFGFGHDFTARLDRLPTTPTVFNPRLPKQLSDLLLKMLTPNPDYRPSADEAFEETFKIVL